MTTASDRAYEIIRAQILNGYFAGGVHLRESELTVLCGVSRTPVREALRRLALSGMVVFTPHQGARVSNLDPDEIDEIYTLRAMVEGHAAKRAAARISRSELERLKRLAAEMEASVQTRSDTGAAAFLTANQEFHQIIMQAAASSRLSAMISLVFEVPLAQRTLSHYSDRELARSMNHHRELITALEAHDGGWAEAIMRSHIFAAGSALARGATPSSRQSSAA
jgi:DNA-binding GntR family transcriptional regulator